MLDCNPNRPRIERIKESAIKREDDGRVWTGKRHHNCIHEIFLETKKSVGRGYIQGFVTELGRFVDRKEGYKIAVFAGQVIRPNPSQTGCRKGEYYDGDELFSEDLY